MTTTKPLNLRNDPDVLATDRRRGHRFQPPIAETRRIPALYATDGVPVEDKTVHLHYFAGACDWYIAELDPETFIAFGWADLGMGHPEWGYIDLAELAVGSISASVNDIPFQQPIERDLWFRPCTFSTITTKASKP